jgi:hypothetical protein
MKSLDIWLPAWFAQKRGPLPAGERHLFICVCDHYEPFHDSDKTGAMRRVREWRDKFGALCREFRDSHGVPPRHTFFYPIEQYDADVLHEIAAMCHETGSDTEVHLHHKDDTAETLRPQLEQGIAKLAEHRLLSRDETGKLRYAFIHGNWALDHSHPEGKNCGVPDELPVLKATGCFADLTMPSAPHPTQTRTINSIYYAREDGRPKSHDRGIPVRVGKPRSDAPEELLCVQGPLGLNWRWRKFGILPRIENADLTGANPPTAARLALWQECRIQVVGRPDWYFVKLHTHGAVERNSTMLLGEPMRRFHRLLRQQAEADSQFHYHYVSARELVNLVHAAEAGAGMEIAAAREFRFKRNGG